MRKNYGVLIERVMSRLLETATPDDSVLNDSMLDDLAYRESHAELSEDDFKRGEWNPLVDDRVKVRGTDGSETDIDDEEIKVGSKGKILNHLVAYRVQFDDDSVGTRWVTKAMIEPS